MTTVLRTTAFLLALGATSPAWAAPKTYDFKDPKGVNNVQFHLDAPLESISGQGTGITGSVSFDPDVPEATKGRIVLAAGSLTVGNPTMLEHLRGTNWLDVTKFAEITFEAKALQHAAVGGGVVRADVSGVLTIKGISKEVTVPVTLTHLPGKLGARLNKPELKGDLLVVRAQFSINRSDFGLQPGQYADKVSEQIELSLSLAGASAE